MKTFSLPLQIRWADIDQNRHMRHSAYYDFGALVRVQLLNELGLTQQKREELHLGPMLFREEALFKREIKMEDKLTISAELLKATPDFIKWSIRHRFVKDDGTEAAVIQIDGAWVDLIKRKLAAPNDLVQKTFDMFPKAEEFEWLPPRTKPSP